MKMTRNKPFLVMKNLLFFFVLILICGYSALGQEDPNAQYVVLHSGLLSDQPFELEAPVEAGVLRLQFSVQYTDQLDLTVLNPLGRPLVLSEPNIIVTEQRDRRTILIWDPRPGLWKIRLSGKGSFTAGVTVQGDLYICCMQFFESRGISSLDRFQPAPGSVHHAQLYASAYSIDRLNFTLIDEQGREIAPVRFRQSDYSNPYSFTIVIETPDRPFRILASGFDQNNRRFRRIFKWLIVPKAAQTEEVITENTPRVTYSNPSMAEIARRAVAGEQKVVRAEVAAWEDRPLLSGQGNQIGIQLVYSIRFPVEGSYSPLPHLYPERIGHGYTGALTMRIQKGSVSPQPEGLKDPDQLVFGARATYKPGILYKFTIDLVPIYLNYNYQTKAWCLQEKPYQQPGIRERFEREVSSENKYRYRISISGTDLDGRQPTLTENTYQPSIWHRSYVREQIPSCR